MSDFKTRFNEIIEKHAKEGFKDEYQRLIKLLNETTPKTPISTFKKTEVVGQSEKSNSLKLWVECCVEKANRKVVKKTDPEYQDVKEYFITRKEQVKGDLKNQNQN
jgi:hypothetical protein